MGTIDITQAVDRVTLNIADYTDPEILDDTTIQYYLDKNDGNEVATTRECAYIVLGALSRQGFARLDRIEIHGQEVFSSYLKYLQAVVNNPVETLRGGGIYAGGIDVADVIANNNDATTVQRRLPIGGEDGEYTILTDPDLSF